MNFHLTMHYVLAVEAVSLISKAFFILQNQPQRGGLYAEHVAFSFENEGGCHCLLPHRLI